MYVHIFKPDVRHWEEFSKIIVKQMDECFDWIHFFPFNWNNNKRWGHVGSKEKINSPSYEYVFVRGVGRTNNQKLKYFQSMCPSIWGISNIKGSFFFFFFKRQW